MPLSKYWQCYLKIIIIKGMCMWEEGMHSKKCDEHKQQLLY